MPFLMDPIGTGLRMNPDDHTMNTVDKEPTSFGDRSKSKVVLMDEAAKSFPDGKWFEFEVAQFAGGFLQELGIGFTQTTPDELKILNEAENFPAKANKLQNTWIVGYQNSCYWNGAFNGLDNNCRFNLSLIGTKPEKETIGLLLETGSGDLVVFKNRMELFRAATAELGAAQIPTDKDLFGVVDMVGGIQRIRIKSSVPPSKQEQEAAKAAAAAAAAAAKKDDKGADDGGGAEAAPAPAEGEAAAAEGEGEGGGDDAAAEG